MFFTTFCKEVCLFVFAPTCRDNHLCKSFKRLFQLHVWLRNKKKERRTNPRFFTVVTNGSVPLILMLAEALTAHREMKDWETGKEGIAILSLVAGEGERRVDASPMESTVVKNVIFFTYFCSSSGRSGRMPLFFAFFYTIDTFLHHSFIHKHSLWPFSYLHSCRSAQWAKPFMGCRAEIRTRPSALHW